MSFEKHIHRCTTYHYESIDTETAQAIEGVAGCGLPFGVVAYGNNSSLHI